MKWFKNLGELYKMLILSGVVAVVLLLLSLIPLFVFSQPGWLIGVAIGSVIEVANITLLYKGSEFAAKKMKPALFLLAYFARMTLFALGFVLTALLGFGFKYGGTVYVEVVPAFINSLWGVLIAYTPLQLVVIIVMLVNKKSPFNMSEGKEVKNG